MSARQVAALVALTLPVLLITVDMTVLGAALPALSQDLAPTASQQLWIVDVYSFVLAGLLVVAGTLGDRIGRRRLLLIGAGAFGVASVAAAFAPTAEALIAARALLGLGGATLMPSTLSLIRTVFPEPARRRVAIGVWASVFSGGAAAGPLVGGWLLEHFWWGSVFLAAVPVTVLLLVAGPFLLPESRDPHPGRFDLPSAALALAAVLPVVYGVKTVATEGPGVGALVAAAIGVVLGVVFVRRQRRLDAPLLDLRLFADRGFATAVVINLLTVFALVGMLLLLPQHLQLVAGTTPLTAALWMVPGTVAGVGGALVAARLARRFPVPRLIVGALAAGGVGFAVLVLLAGASPAAAPLVVVVGFALGGGAVALVEALTTDIVVSSAPPDRTGAASAVSETGFELGGALGTAVLGSVAAAVYRAGLPAGVPGETLGGTVAAVAGRPDATGVLDAARAAFSTAVGTASAVAATVLALTAVWAWVRLRTPATTPAPRPDALVG